MITIFSRRLRVRDDGTGAPRESTALLSEFEAEDAIVLLGDPGMGKTTFFRNIAKNNFTTVRNFLIAPQTIAGEPIFLDALDEYRTIASGQDAVAEVAKALWNLEKPQFRISCRAADWFGSVDQEALKIASASGRVVVLELCPLSRDEILEAVKGTVPDPGVFLDEAESAGVGNLLGNPQTLELVARVWGTGKKPRNKFEAYEMGVSELLKETNIQHAPRGVDSPDLLELRKAAGATASTILLSNSIGISRTAAGVGNGYFRIPSVPYPNKSDVDIALRRRLFTSSQVDRFEPIHRTIAEFLAAEDLSSRIMAGLPIERVMALVCGVDGKPVSSLRGLFAWLMCNVLHLADGYVGRDPYGVVLYGDASVLPPGGQCAIWGGLRRLHDPWFLAREDDRGSFRDLANANTAKIMKEILIDAKAGVHLKIAVLEAIANSSGNIGLNAILRSIVFEKDKNTWVRSTAVRAFAKSVQNDWGELERLDHELTQAVDDPDAPEVRIDLLLLTPKFGNLPLRVLSILEQASADQKERMFGRFYPLLDFPSDTDLDVILDGASRVLKHTTEDDFEFKHLFDKWLRRRLEAPGPITLVQLSTWLQNIRTGRHTDSEEALSPLKEHFKKDPSLFKSVFEMLANSVPNAEHSFSLFLFDDLWKMLPHSVWPIPKCEFFLEYGEKEKDPKRASDLFWAYLSWFPMEEASVVLAEKGFDFLTRRPDVSKELGNWNSCRIEKWQKDQAERRQKDSRKRAGLRAQNVTYFTPRLKTIREGGNEPALPWATKVYYGLFSDIKGEDGRERLVSVINEQIADAIIQGFIRYAENPNIPKKEEIIESWDANKIPTNHLLLSLSVFLRLNAGMDIPEKSLPDCIAAAVTGFDSAKIQGYAETMRAWILKLARQNSKVLKSVLSEIWILEAKKKKGFLPRFHELKQDPGSLNFLASLAIDVLSAGVDSNDDAVSNLSLILLLNDQREALTIGQTEIARNELSAEVRAIWTTVLFDIDPEKYLENWEMLISSGPDHVIWEAIELIRGPRYERGGLSLTSAQRAEVITSVGRRFPMVSHPLGSSTGSRNPWDASEFIAHQTGLLAVDPSPEVGLQLEKLENDTGLTGYRDLIRHERTQYKKQQRESSFAFPDPEQVAEAISNRAPANPGDLLAFIVDHLFALGKELTRTQRERYRAYWNERGRDLISPKREEVCSGLLADDLQNRVVAHGLIVTVEHHMVADKECDLVVLQGNKRLLPIEVKHHYNADLWRAWRTQLDSLYSRDAKSGGLGIYLVLWSGEAKGRKLPKLPKGIDRPDNAPELKKALEALIPDKDHHRLKAVVIDISNPRIQSS